jgi:DNA-binding SARP family transcriptional activator
MEFRVLGPLEIVDDERERALAGAKERAVLARLLLEPGRVVAVDDVLESVWRDVPRAAAARSLAVRLANLRGFLEPGRPRGARSTVLRHEAGGYRLTVDPERVDAQRFAAKLRRAASAAPASALAACDEALALWRGTPLPELADVPLARAEIHRLEELRAQAATWRMRALVDLGRHDAALPELRRLVAEEPWREEPAQLLALALYRSGRQVEALDAVRALAAELRELGLDAGPETRALERQILEHDAALAAPARAREPPAPQPERAHAGPRLPVRASRFIGREADLARAAELADHHTLLTVTGVGGAGKTRLALELAERLGDRFGAARWW